MRAKQYTWGSVVALFALMALLCASGFKNAEAQTTGGFSVYLPLIYRQVPPATPVFQPIQNADQDNYFVVSWSADANTDYYLLQESTDPSFANPTVYGPIYAADWMSSDWKVPAIYYYRVKGVNQVASGAWSNVQSITIYPMFVGLQIRWDGEGYIRGSEYQNIGTHETMVFNSLTGPDTIRADSHYGYNPNPYDWEDTYSTSYYSPTTGVYKSGTWIDDPAWKFGYSWHLGYDTILADGVDITIDGQPFSVRGPLSGYTTWGTSITYWELVNKTKILFWADGSGWEQIVEVGDAVLRYDAGGSRLLLYDNVKRTLYYQGNLDGDTVQYISHLSSSNSIAGSPIFNPSLLAEENLRKGENKRVDKNMKTITLP